MRLKEEKSTQKERKTKNSRSMTTRERSSVQSVRSSIWRGIGGKAKKSYQGWCLVLGVEGRERELTLPTESGTKTPEPRRNKKTPVGSLLPRGVANYDRRGFWCEISHTREYAQARTHNKSSHMQKEEQQKQQKQQKQQISRTANKAGTSEIWIWICITQQTTAPAPSWWWWW